jgi:hypothetical protein
MKSHQGTVIAASILWAAAASALYAVPTPTVTLLSNLDQPTQPSATVVGLNQFLAAPFITGESGSIFESVTIPLMAFASSQGDFRVSLHIDDAGLPGGTMADGVLSGDSGPRASSLYTYAAVADLFLNPNTRYWIVADSDFATPNANYGWYDTLSFDYSSVAGWQLPGHLASSHDAGATWRSNEDALIPRPLKFEVAGMIVPEPSSLALAGLGTLALAVRPTRRLRQCKTARAI